MRLYYAQAMPVYILSFSLFQTVKLHFYTAVSDLEQLIVTEENVLNSLDLYLEIEEERLREVKRKREQFARIHELAKTDGEQFLWNPVNAYLLIKRLTTDWYETYHLIESPYSRDMFKKAASQIMIYPEETDLVGAADALFRLQDYYSLDSLNMAPARVEGVTLSTELTVEDCFLLGRHAYQTKKWQQSLFWLQESLNILENKEDAVAAHKIEILIHMANVHNSLKNFTAAAEISETILNVDPNHAQAKENLKFYRTQEENQNNSEKLVDGVEPALVPDEKTSSTGNTFRSLCQRGQKKQPEDEKQLQCFLTSSDDSYFLLQPIKVEVLNLKPLLMMYHDILKDGEAEILKALAYPKLLESPIPVRNPERKRSARIFKSALFHEDEHYVVTKFNRRIQAITGLKSHSGAPFQVVNFGIGGHYEPHLDNETIRDELQADSEMGYPVSSLMVYLSDVISGGSTVFTEIGVEVKPVKGTALFWYNFHKNGTGDEVTRHGDCPVLIGSKWVANKWFYSHGNEFIRKCALNQLE